MSRSESVHPWKSCQFQLSEIHINSTRLFSEVNIAVDHAVKYESTDRLGCPDGPLATIGLRTWRANRGLLTEHGRKRSPKERPITEAPEH